MARRSSTKLKNALVPWLFVLPGIVFTFIFRYYTMFRAVWISLHSYNVANPPGPFVGLANYIALLKLPLFWQAWANTLAYLALFILLVFFVPVIQAVFLSEVPRGRSVFSTLYLLPALIPLSVAVIFWKYIFAPFNYGLANYLLSLMGTGSRTWFSDPQLSKLSITIPGMLGGGFGVLLYLSAIFGVSPDLTEAAHLEGCTSLQRLWYITLPNIMFLVRIQLVLAVIGVVQILDPVQQYTPGGGMGHSSTSVAYLVYHLYNRQSDFGKAEANAVLMLIVIAGITLLQMRLNRSQKSEE